MFAATAMSAQTEQTDTVKIVNNADRVTVTQTGSDTKVQIIHNNDSGSFSVYEYAVSETPQATPAKFDSDRLIMELPFTKTALNPRPIQPQPPYRHGTNE